jgi:outer membrane protein assembly factor BamD
MISKSKLITPLILGFLFFGGCAGKIKEETESADQLYKKANEAFNKKKYSDAIDYFYKLKYDYPAEAANVMADLKIADAHFYNKDYQGAITSYEDFRKLHPTSPHIPYAVYQLGLCHYKQILTIDRDQKHTQMALNEFYYLLTNYKSSSYAPHAKEKYLDCQKRLSANEAYIAKFYYKKEKFKAAIHRFEAAISNYPDIPLKDEMLYFLADSYLQIGEEKKAKNTYQILLQKYPESKYVKRAKDLLTKKSKKELSSVSDRGEIGEINGEMRRFL